MNARLIQRPFLSPTGVGSIFPNPSHVPCTKHGSQVNSVGNAKLQGFWVGVRLSSLTLLSFWHTQHKLCLLPALSPHLVSNISIGGIEKSRGAVLALRCDDGEMTVGHKKWARSIPHCEDISAAPLIPFVVSRTINVDVASGVGLIR